MENQCDRTILIRGIYKGKSTAGTIYYEDRSAEILPGEWTSDMKLPGIKESYNAKNAPIGSTVYFKAPLK